MSTQSDQVKVLEQCRISPPLNSVPSTSFPVTSFDLMWLNFYPIQRVFLYQVPFSTAQFTEEVLPQLKNSLSLALQRFFPFCGNLVCPPQPTEPYILYIDGDSIPFLVAQCNSAFGDLLKDEPKDAKEIHSLLPPTLPTHVLDEALTELTSLLAVQITLFPNSGLCIGIKFRHVVADGWSFNHFVKTWASIFKAGCDMSNVIISLPFLDKGVIKDQFGRKRILLDHWQAGGSWTGKVDMSALTKDLVRATFTLSRSDIELMKKWILGKCHVGKDTRKPKLHLSSYVVTSAFIWVCVIKSLDVVTANCSLKSEEEQCHFCVTADCRNRYALGIPVAFFGNCVMGKLVSVARKKFRQEDSIATVAVAISECVQSFEYGVVDGHTSLLSKWMEASASGEHILTVAGSPKLGAYETDFGWGKLAKTEVVHIDISQAISLSESKNGDGGIEVGICRSRHEMNIFKSFFQAGLNKILVAGLSGL